MKIDKDNGMNRIFDDYEALSRFAAELFAESARHAIHHRGRFVVALSGGDTPQRAFEILAQAPLRDAVEWSRLEVFWSDERCVPRDDPRSNAHNARLRLLDHVPVPEERMHPIECADSPMRAARQTEIQIRAIFGEAPPRFDLIFLGVGTDGHTASLFPGSDLLNETRRWVREVQTAASKPDRVSFTPVLINQADWVVFLVSGSRKSAIVREIQQGPREPRRLPAQSIRPATDRTLWLLDRAAASGLAAGVAASSA